MGYKDPERQKEFQLRWIQLRREECIAYLGGKCDYCGSTDRLEFDHIDPENKSSGIAQLLSHKWETIKSELDKCHLLCYDCHRLKTNIEQSKLLVHGTEHGYRKCGCKCDLCRAAHAKAVMEWRIKSGKH